jgi:hypothetical protein
VPQAHQAAITYQRGWGEYQRLPMIMFVIIGGGHPIMVGTGTPELVLETLDLAPDPDGNPYTKLALRPSGRDRDEGGAGHGAQEVSGGLLGQFARAVRCGVEQAEHRVDGGTQAGLSRVR